MHQRDGHRTADMSRQMADMSDWSKTRVLDLFWFVFGVFVSQTCGHQSRINVRLFNGLQVMGLGLQSFRIQTKNGGLKPLKTLEVCRFGIFTPIYRGEGIQTFPL